MTQFANQLFIVPSLFLAVFMLHTVSCSFFPSKNSSEHKKSVEASLVLYSPFMLWHMTLLQEKRETF